MVPRLPLWFGVGRETVFENNFSSIWIFWWMYIAANPFSLSDFIALCL